MTKPRGFPLFASLALALLAAPAVTDAQVQQDQKMVPSPLDTGGRSLEEYLDQGKEWEVTFGSVSPEARDTIEKWARGGELDKVELYTLPDGRIFFEAHIDKDGQDLEVLVAPDGQTIAVGEDVAD
ncbi:hypothetical protein [Polyangium spumosum]|uniref:PepSY domain-containing protein n=1 Tax=Polyangium spumosum TaxID=889282 RepID=A0A6N7PYD6_9BACT|nr:hypothetical protein [Polyangium spumosum]MRG96577.1 hypothetical protein [Polyangium spumosum]